MWRLSLFLNASPTRTLWIKRLALNVLSLLIFFPQLAYAIDWQSLRINGYSSFEFEKQLSDKGNGDPNDSFDADLLDVVFNFYPAPRPSPRCTIRLPRDARSHWSLFRT